MSKTELKKADLDVVAVGNAMVDVLAACDDTLILEHGMQKGVMQLVFEEESAQKIYDAMPPATEKSGGSAANTVAAMAALGGAVGFIGKVADDELGEIFAHDMRASGVAYDTAPLSGGPSTARCMILVTPDAERTMNTYLGASVEFSDDDIDKALIEKGKILYLEGYLYDKPKAKKAFSMASEMAREAGGKVALTLSDPFCVERHRDDFLDLIKGKIDIVFANEDEVKALYPELSAEQAHQTLSSNVDILVMTCGARGAVITAKSGSEKTSVPAFETVVKDTTGAGDLYAAGFLHGLSQGHDMEDCGLMGSACAAEIISHLGARPECDLKDYVARKLNDYKAGADIAVVKAHG